MHNNLLPVNDLFWKIDCCFIDPLQSWPMEGNCLSNDYAYNDIKVFVGEFKRIRHSTILEVPSNVRSFSRDWLCFTYIYSRSKEMSFTVQAKCIRDLS